MKSAEDAIMSRQSENFLQKSRVFAAGLGGRTVLEYYTHALAHHEGDIPDVQFEIRKQPSYPVFREKITELPWNKYPIIIAGGSFSTGKTASKVTDSDRILLQTLLDTLDPEKVFFVVGHKLLGQEKYLVQQNRRFDVYSIIPSLMTRRQLQKLSAANLTGIRVSTESQEMGIYKSFNYEIFERRNCVLLAFDGNSSLANLIQEGRNGKGRTRIFLYPRSPMLRAKATSLEGYVTIDASAETVVEKIRQLENNIGTKR